MPIASAFCGSSCYKKNTTFYLPTAVDNKETVDHALVFLSKALFTDKL